MPASEEIINMLAQAPDILEFKPSEQARTRVWDLVAREKEGTLTADEKNELDHYAQIEHLMRLVKAQARKRRMIWFSFASSICARMSGLTILSMTRTGVS